VQQAYNRVGQLCEIAPTASGCSDSSYYASGFSYNAPGKLTGFNYGNGLTATFYYSPDRSQLTYLAYSKGSSTYFNLQYSYGQLSGYFPPCPKGTAGNNGSIQCIFDNVDLGRSVRFDYDPVQRITSAKTCGSSAFPQWSLAQSYDRFGNRWSQTVTAGSGPSSSLSFGANGMNSSTTNQPNGYTFDPSGNMTVEPLGPPNNMTYDGENRMTGFQGVGGTASYTYDGNGQRVVKSVSGATSTVSIFSGGSIIAEYDNGAATGSPSREYVVGSSGLLAMFSGGATTYYHQDHLSVRLTTDANGNILTQEGHFPYGEQWYQSGAANKLFFTSYDRDSESGLDYALARYYDSRTGTFCSADPLAGSPSDPQSWNRYPYGRNDPADITDPSGKSWESDLVGGLLDVASIFVPALAPAALAYNFGNSAAEGQVPFGAVIGGAYAAYLANAPGAGAATGAGAPPENAPGPVLFNRGNAPTITYAGGVDETGEPIAAASSGAGAGAGAGVAAAIDTGAAINNAKNALSKNCDSVFKKLIPGYTKAGFFKTLSNATINQFPGGTPPQDSLSYGADAVTHSPRGPIDLLPNFYGLSANTQAFVLIHEGIHLFGRGRLGDAAVQRLFGLQVSGNTDNITQYIQGGCNHR
jgi:RHS repeat-associated protein